MCGANRHVCFGSLADTQRHLYEIKKTAVPRLRPFTLITTFARLLSKPSATFEVGTALHSKAFSIMDHPTARQRAELLFQKRQEKAISEIQAKQEATRELTAKLRAERLKHQAMGETKADRKPKD